MEELKMEDLIGKKVVVDNEVLTILRPSSITSGYFARLERTGEEIYIADFQIKKVLEGGKQK